MSFLDMFPPPLRERFEAAGERLTVARGRHLLRRGEPGGDVYLVREGELEIVDTRTVPEVILATLGAGAVVGEMAFIDDSPRSADVRASTDVVVTRWARDDLKALFQRQPALGSAFYECVARLAAERLRRLTKDAITGGIGGSTAGQPGVGTEAVRDQARHIAERAKEGLIAAEGRLALPSPGADAVAALHAVLDQLQHDVAELVEGHPSIGDVEVATRLLTRELHPYLVRSGLAARCIRRPQGVTGTAEVLAHVLVDAATGDGPLGEALDRWLLQRPTNRALRAFRVPVARLVRDALPRHRNRRVLVVNAGTGSLLAELIHLIAHPPTVITVVDQSRDALAFLDAGITTRPNAVELVTHQENLAQFAMGGPKRPLPPQDVVVLHGLLEYMPDRIASSLLDVARRHLNPHGVVIATALGPSPDEPLLSWLLGWPTVRRSREALRRVFRAGRLTVTAEPVLDAPAMVVSAASAE